MPIPTLAADTHYCSVWPPLVDTHLTQLSHTTGYI